MKRFTSIRPSHPSFKQDDLEVLSLEELAQDHREGPKDPGLSTELLNDLLGPQALSLSPYWERHQLVRFLPLKTYCFLGW